MQKKEILTRESDTHSCMPSLLASDPIRVQSYVCCLFWTNRNSMAVTSIFLSISLSNQKYESFNRRRWWRRLYSKWKYLLLLKLWCYPPSFTLVYIHLPPPSFFSSFLSNSPLSSLHTLTFFNLYISLSSIHPLLPRSSSLSLH